MQLTASPSSWRALAIDDEPDNLRLVVALLKFRGVTIEGVCNGEAGLTLAESFRPNLVLLDISMPKMNGWQVHRTLRERPEMAHTVIIALTAHAMPGDAERVMAEGFDGYIAKPFRAELLMTEIGRVVERFLMQSPPQMYPDLLPAPQPNIVVKSSF